MFQATVNSLNREELRTHDHHYPRAMMQGWESMKPSIVFQCDDIDGTYERMKANGVKFLEAPNKMPWGTYARFADEDGNEFLLKG
ncbi:MAG TPA: VOC family protein [Paenibacillus sp.]|uniref:VOC family protein n=1 Tax=Paenibacillus sp. TaxID=58172 RepID=UPI0028D324CE|nr:VOC family protein [Paenibacillus sp.]HUC91244.1 VOC family protein [Paenibacillus sp.]